MNPLVEWLSRPETYADSPASVRLVETHISWVFLTDRFAYKLKKPVRFEFLDFTSAEARRAAFEDEVRLNRRLAADVYLGVLAVRQDAAGRFTLDERDSAAGDARGPAAAPPAVDWLVKMRRLPAERTLAELLCAGGFAEADLQRLATRLADFYRSAAPLAIEPAEYRRAIERHVRANRAELMQSLELVSLSAVRRAHAAQLQLLAQKPAMFDERVAAGRVVEGHGDLRPEHIYLLPEPAIIDCIEFSAELRQIDSADELSFLAAECDFLGAEAAGRQIADRCLAALADAPPPELLAFYRSYRACVRAKVAALRSRQLRFNAQGACGEALADAAGHLELADRYTSELAAAARPLLLVVHGLMGSGKSTLAAALADQFGGELFSTDTIRRQMFGPSGAPAGYNAGPYRPKNRLAVYWQMFDRAEESLKQRIPAVLDGTFISRALREQAVELALRHSARAAIVHCCCPPEIAKRRIVERAAAGPNLSEARPNLYERQRADEEPNPPELAAIDVDTTASPTAQLALVLDRLRTSATMV